MKQDDVIQQLFTAYADAFDKLDIEKQADLFADSFIMAGPKGANSSSVEEFRKTAAKTVAFYKSVGQTGAQILSIEQSPVTNEYVLVKVHWAVTFQKTGDRPVEFDVSYIVHTSLSEPKIIMALTHEDEAEAMKKLSLK